MRKTIPIGALAALLLLCLAARSADAAGPANPRCLAVLPVEAINLEEADRARLERLLLAQLGAKRVFSIIAPAALPQVTSACAREASCLAKLGKAHGADQLLVLSVGRLGDTYVLRMAVYRGAGGTRVGSWQQVLNTIDGAAAKDALDAMINAFAPRPPSPRKARWYQRWWVWTAASVVIAGAVTAAVLSSTGGRDPDARIRP